MACGLICKALMDIALALVAVSFHSPVSLLRMNPINMEFPGWQIDAGSMIVFLFFNCTVDIL